MPVSTRFRGKQHDVAAVGERGERVYKGVDEVTIGPANQTRIKAA